MIRDLYNVRVRPTEDIVTPLTYEEEQRFRAVLFSELGNEIADRGRARFPAYTPQDRRRLVKARADSLPCGDSRCSSKLKTSAA
ncbi:hypothetical protein ABZT45_43865 [Streptomyces sp. NPDC005356]|uniref:hypothetical protein n=1 Tax=unclassified Streptomyces TaxID=2593676 RepID=UPI0033BCE3E8